MRTVTFVLLLWVLALLALLFYVSPVPAAPAPLEKSQRSKTKLVNPPEHCVMVWNGTPYSTTFSPDGNYRAVEEADSAAVFIGHWRLDRGSLEFTISERMEKYPESQLQVYVLRMKPDLSGNTTDSITFRAR